VSLEVLDSKYSLQRGLTVSTPKMLKEQIDELKEGLKDKNAPFGVDLLLPQVGGSARKTNYDYTHGHLDELIDVIIDSGTTLFVSAVGVPPRHVVDRLHKAKIPIMNMIGHPKHVNKALEAGVDIICAQGGEGGGHTGAVPTSILIPEVVALCQGKKSSLNGQPIYVVAAGGIYNGKSLAASLMFGAQGVWVGTRFVCAKEAGASKSHQEAIVESTYDETIRTLIFTGRPLRVRKNPYIMNWETERREEMQGLLDKGVLPVQHDLDTVEKLEAESKNEEELNSSLEGRLAGLDIDDVERPYLMGEVAAAIRDVKPAKEIIDEMIKEAIQQLRLGSTFIEGSARL